jgi:hypothetical protein
MGDDRYRITFINPAIKSIKNERQHQRETDIGVVNVE